MLSLPGQACIHQDEVSETTSVAITETIRPVLPFVLRRRPATPSGAHGPPREVRGGLPRPHPPLRGPRGRIPNGRSRGTAAPCPTARSGSRACNRAFAVVSPSTRPIRRAAGLRRGGAARRDPRPRDSRRTRPRAAQPHELAPPEGIMFARGRVDGRRGAYVN